MEERINLVYPIIKAIELMERLGNGLQRLYDRLFPVEERVRREFDACDFHDTGFGKVKERRHSDADLYE